MSHKTKGKWIQAKCGAAQFMQLTDYDPSCEQSARELMVDLAKRFCQNKIDKAQGEAEKDDWLLKRQKKGADNGKGKGAVKGEGQGEAKGEGKEKAPQPKAKEAAAKQPDAATPEQLRPPKDMGETPGRSKVGDEQALVKAAPSTPPRRTSREKSAPEATPTDKGIVMAAFVDQGPPGGNGKIDKSKIVDRSALSDKR